MKIGNDACGGWMEDYIFAGKAFRKVQYSCSCGIYVGDRVDPASLAESICL
jgi:hypothetical protein